MQFYADSPLCFGCLPEDLPLRWSSLPNKTPATLFARFASQAGIAPPDADHFTAGGGVGALNFLKYGLPPTLYNFTIDTHHTTHYAVGKMIAEVNPRIGMVTHFQDDEDVIAETIAGVRTHWNGLFQLGVDVAVVNVTKDAVWYRKAVLPDKSGAVPPMRELMQMAKRTGKPLPKEFVFPTPRNTREAMQEPFVRENEIDPKDYTPADVQREQITSWPKDFKIDLEEMISGRKPTGK